MSKLQPYLRGRWANGSIQFLLDCCRMLPMVRRLCRNDTWENRQLCGIRKLKKINEILGSQHVNHSFIDRRTQSHANNSYKKSTERWKPTIMFPKEKQTMKTNRSWWTYWSTQLWCLQSITSYLVVKQLQCCWFILTANMYQYNDKIGHVFHVFMSGPEGSGLLTWSCCQHRVHAINIWL